MPRLTKEQQVEFDTMISGFNETTDITGNNPFRFKYLRYQDTSKRYIRNTDQYIYDMYVHIDYKPVFDYHFYNMLKQIQKDIEKKNG
jgi:hypothetical protein